MSVCKAPISKGVRKGQTATGTRTGYHRHWRAGEPACELCREANAAYLADWRSENPDAYDEWRKANPDKVAARDRRYRQKHAAQITKATRQWYARNPGKRAEYTRRWRERHPKQHAENQRQRRAMKAQVTTGGFTTDDLERRLSMFGFRCWMCGGPFEHVDHVKPISRGGAHLLANLRPACMDCNVRKGNQWPFLEVSLVT